MKNKTVFLKLLLPVSAISVFTFLKSPEELTEMLSKTTEETSFLAVIMHFLFLAFFLSGVFSKEARTIFFSSLLLILSGSALALSIMYLIPSNIMIFMVFFILSLEAVIKKKIRFDFANSGVLGKIIGTAAFSAGF
ncbi:hypothetical protein [Marispirochaeta sp.]|uniref:hypothetical protein n=1 Tax=Marispirochaeta sp. TaxID=2038653 RepID=UPI0029C97600|nr:hypothetical protein [Marispirochaeta sp.]